MLICLVAGLISLFFTQAQSLKKYPIGNSGCSFYNYCESKIEVDYSTDSSKVYTGECTVNGVAYGVICVKLFIQVEDLDDAEELMISYLDHLKTSFVITKASGYGKGQKLKDNPQARGVVDYWRDNENDYWKIKSWTDGKFIGFMYAYSKKELPTQKVDVFLESFRLPKSP